MTWPSRRSKSSRGNRRRMSEKKNLPYNIHSNDHPHIDAEDDSTRRVLFLEPPETKNEHHERERRSPLLYIRSSCVPRPRTAHRSCFAGQSERAPPEVGDASPGSAAADMLPFKASISAPGPLARMPAHGPSRSRAVSVVKAVFSSSVIARHRRGEVHGFQAELACCCPGAGTGSHDDADVLSPLQLENVDATRDEKRGGVVGGHGRYELELE